MPLFTWLLSIAWPLVKKVMVMLGIGIISYAGLSAIGAEIQSAVLSSWGQLGGATLQIATLGGIPQSIGIILGALNARIAYIAIGKIGRVTA